MKHFVTLFLPAENVHLIKDVGQIPYQMQRYFGYQSTLVCYKNADAYPYLHDEVEGLKLKFIENKGTTLFWEKAAVSFLFKNARNIDVLNLYHLSQASMMYGILYKLLNPGGVLFLKLDFNLHRYKKEGFRFSANAAKDKIHHLLLRWFLRKVDIISAETREVLSVLKEADPRFADLLLHLPNGVDESWFEETPGQTQKENIILTAGRIGLPEKNHDLLLHALAKMELGEWRAVFAGPVQESFKARIEQFYSENPSLKNKVKFTGPIVDRGELRALYERAKIFCLPSRSEGFPMALIEALACGNYLVGTDKITSIAEMTDNGRLGNIIPAGNAEALRKALEELMTDGFYDDTLTNDIMQHAQQFRWKPILSNLDQRINKIRGDS